MVAASGSWSIGSRSFKSVVTGIPDETPKNEDPTTTHLNAFICMDEYPAGYTLVRHNRRKQATKNSPRPLRMAHRIIPVSPEIKDQKKVTKLKASQGANRVTSSKRNSNRKVAKVGDLARLREAVHLQEPFTSHRMTQDSRNVYLAVSKRPGAQPVAHKTMPNWEFTSR